MIRWERNIIREILGGKKLSAEFMKRRNEEIYIYHEYKIDEIIISIKLGNWENKNGKFKGEED